MPYRYTPEEAALMQQRIEANLANFQRNSGRGLPAQTLKEMEESAGVKMDAHGNPVPAPADGAALRRAYAPTANAPAIARYRKRAECHGILFDSMLEMRRYKELKLLMAAKKIRYFLRQVPFHLPGDIVYRVDFMVVHYLTKSCTDENPVAICRIEYEDCKAKPHKRSNDHDRVSVNKRKQVKALYGVEVKLIHKAKA
jgi:hypothetical protein